MLDANLHMISICSSEVLISSNFILSLPRYLPCLFMQHYLSSGITILRLGQFAVLKCKLVNDDLFTLVRQFCPLLVNALVLTMTNDFTTW